MELGYGAPLKDVNGRIVAVGKNIRHIKIKSLEQVDADYFVDLLRQSINLLQTRT